MINWQWRPTFDVWFWLLVVWSIAIPYVFDAAHITSCRTEGKVTFVPLSSLWADDTRTFECREIPTAGENIAR